MESDLKTYYSRRASEYEDIYQKPERQTDLLAAAALLQNVFANQSVLEIACGTGYWTQRIAETADSVLATDLSENVIDIAKNKSYPRRNVRFEVVDLYRLVSLTNKNAIFGGFIWSHIPKQDLPKFIRHVHELLPTGSRVVFMDNRYVPGSNTPISHQDEFGNTYQIRTLQNGEHYVVVKNFPEKTELEKLLITEAEELTVLEYPHFWICQYRTKGRG